MKVQRSYTEIIKDMAGIVKKLMKELSITEDQLTGVGIGSPGTIDAELEHDASAEKVVSN